MSLFPAALCGFLRIMKPEPWPHLPMEMVGASLRLPTKTHPSPRSPLFSADSTSQTDTQEYFFKNTSECKREFPWLPHTYFLKKILKNKPTRQNSTQPGDCLLQ